MHYNDQHKIENKLWLKLCHAQYQIKLEQDFSRKGSVLVSPYTDREKYGERGGVVVLSVNS